MPDLTNLLPQESPVVEAIYAYHKKRGDAEQSRGYLGASIIGHHCDRYLWYSFRQCFRADFPGRMYRLFETGDMEEARFVRELRAIGCEVHDIDERGEQFAVSALGGHFSGHMDGCAVGVPEAPKTWHLLEFKTHNAKSFAKLKDGVKASKPQHYAQMQVYMCLGKLTRALYLARNKDTDDLYAERVHYNNDEAEALMARAERIIRSNEPPARCNERNDWWECRYCDARPICRGSIIAAVPVPRLSCRHCCHATPAIHEHETSARWGCSRLGTPLSRADQDKPCGDHLMLPGLVNTAETVDYGSDDGGEYIGFKWQNGDEWVHGHCDGRVNSRDLISLPASLLSNGLVRSAYKLMGADLTRVVEDILDRYPESDCRQVWRGDPAELFDQWRAIYKEPLEGLNPIKRSKAFDHDAAEYGGGRVVILWHAMGNNLKQCEIREVVE